MTLSKWPTERSRALGRGCPTEFAAPDSARGALPWDGANFLESIHQQGLLKRSRHHVHLSADRETAIKVGLRRGKPIVLTIDAAKMFADGQSFFLSANGVWLTESVPTQFIEFET